MKMRKFKQATLFRDKMVERLEKKGSVVHWQFLDDDVYDKALRVKLSEEVAEVAVAKTRDELLQELADVQEVIDALAALHDISHAEITAVKEKKHDDRGGFEGRTYVTIVEHPEGSPAAQYCLAQPSKYPEIID